MIAMLLGLFLLIGSYAAYQSTKKVSSLKQEQIVLQDKARFAFSFIASKLQQAGDFGCVSSVGKMRFSNLVNTTSATFKPWRVIEGWEAKNTGRGTVIPVDSRATVTKVSNGTTLSSNWETSVDIAELETSVKSVRKSDVLKIWYSDQEAAQVSTISGDDITISEMDLNKGNIIVLNDCQSVMMAQVCSCDTDDGASTPCKDMDANINISSSCTGLEPGNRVANLTTLNVSTTEVRRLKLATFFVNKLSADRDNPPTLYWKKLANNGSLSSAEALIEDVENIQFLYGEDTDNDLSPNYYVSANDVAKWANVTSLKINILLRSHKPLLASSQPVTFNKTTLTPDADDHFLRQQFSTTIAIRNRITAK
jgi:type IV pilus assembly protein PilW